MSAPHLDINCSCLDGVALAKGLMTTQRKNISVSMFVLEVQRESNFWIHLVYIQKTDDSNCLLLILSHIHTRVMKQESA